MSLYASLPVRSFIAAADLAAYVRVKLNATKDQVALAVAGDDCIGITEKNAKAGEAVSVRLKNSQGTVMCLAGGAFAYGATVYGIADGKVDDVSNAGANKVVGTALQAASGDGSVVEVLL